LKIDGLRVFFSRPKVENPTLTTASKAEGKS